MSRLLLVLMLGLSLPALQGCVPVVAGGAATGALMASDRRTSGIYIEDQSIELKAQGRLDEQLKDKIHVNVTSYNLSVLLTGETFNEATRTEAERIVKSVPNVRQVFNELAIAPTAGYSARSEDSLITTKVKARMVETDKLQANHIKVTTEAGVVYLMGLVNHKEADIAVELTRTTAGVTKVVKLFEYLD
jgi:osmotically-inducible protein OsmY